MEECAGRTVPARVPAACIPRPVFRQIGAFSLSKSPKRPQVRVMRTKQTFAKRRAAFLGYPHFAIFLVNLVQNFRLIVIISQNDKAGYMLCGRFEKSGSYTGNPGLLRTRIPAAEILVRAAGRERGAPG